MEKINKRIKEANMELRDELFYTNNAICFICKQVDAEENLIELGKTRLRVHKECGELHRKFEGWICDKCRLYFPKSTKFFIYHPKWNDNIIHTPDHWKLCAECFEIVNRVDKKE